MADNTRKGSACPQLTSPSATDGVLAVANVSGVTNTFLVPFSAVLGNTPADHRVANGFNLILGGQYTPANSTANTSVVRGTIVLDANFFYYATANGHFKRAALSDF